MHLITYSIKFTSANMQVMDIRDVLGRNLKSMREAWGYTQTQVAEMCNFEPTSYSRWENGKVWPTPETINKLALLFHCSPSYFYQDGTVPDLNPLQILELSENVTAHSLAKLLIKKIEAIPEDILESSYWLKPSNEAWEEIRNVIDSDIKKRRGDMKPMSEQARTDAAKKRQELLRKLKE